QQQGGERRGNNFLKLLARTFRRKGVLARAGEERLPAARLAQFLHFQPLEMLPLHHSHLEIAEQRHEQAEPSRRRPHCAGRRVEVSRDAHQRQRRHQQDHPVQQSNSFCAKIHRFNSVRGLQTASTPPPASPQCRWLRTQRLWPDRPGESCCPHPGGRPSRIVANSARACKALSPTTLPARRVAPKNNPTPIPAKKPPSKSPASESHQTASNRLGPPPPTPART